MQPLAIAKLYRLAMTFKTSQVTSYAAGDDGDMEIGLDHDYVILITGQYAGTVNISLGTVPKTDVHSNACVYDRRSRLMWSRTVSASVGPTSNGLLPWTTNAGGEGIFTYAAAANAAALAGYSDWRVPNINELFLLSKQVAPNGYPDQTTFPATVSNIWSSTTRPDVTANAIVVSYNNGYPISTLKTTAGNYCRLVRGPL